MKMYFLKFATEVEAKIIMAQYMNEDGFITATNDYAIDVVGTIHAPTGATLTDEDGNSYPEMAPINGFHVNMAINELPAELMPFSINPITPSRVFAGMEV